MAEARSRNNALVTGGYAIFAIVPIVAFLAYRGDDIGRLGQLIGNLGGGPLAGFEGIRDSVGGAITALIIVFSWLCLGSFITYFIKVADRSAYPIDIAIKAAVGAAAYSLIWFFLGLLGLYNGYAAALSILLGFLVSIYSFTRGRTADRVEVANEDKGVYDQILLAIIGIAVLLAFVASLAPPTAKDTLLYHFSVPKAFVAQHSNAFVDGNIASYLSLGVETLYVWPMIFGRAITERASESAAGATAFAFFPLLLMTTYGWARESGLTARWSLIATAVLATVPTAFHVAASAYIDLALALFVTLAIYSLTRWWRSGEIGWTILTAIFLGAALTIKLTAVFVIAAFALVVLLKARSSDNVGKTVATGFGALVLAGLIASPWYLRTWVATGSPVFPFYMSIWPGRANGWDVERSNLFQAMNSQYGGVDTNKLNLITAPVRLSVAAQPEQAANYDGVLGPAFLLGLPVLVWALWKFDMPVEVKIGSGVAAIIYLFWLFSSEQLRYLLPILPVLAIGIAASVEAMTKRGDVLRRVLKYSFAAASVAGILTSLAWFCQRAPVRVVLGGEVPDQYLARNLDYYPFYQEVNTNTAPDARVWLINMRRDTYTIERPVVSDYLFEDWTLRKMVWEANSADELRAKAAAMNVQYVLARHDFLFDYEKSTLVDDKKPRAENEAKIKMARAFLLDTGRTIKADNKFTLIKVS